MRVLPEMLVAPTISRVQAAVAIVARITRYAPADRGRHAGVWSPRASPARHDRPRVRADPRRLPRRGAARARGSARAEGGAAEAGGRSSECFPAGRPHGARRARYSTPGRAEIAPPGRSWRFPAGARRPDRIGGRAPAGNPGGGRDTDGNPAISLESIRASTGHGSVSFPASPSSRGRTPAAIPRWILARS
jgi:hypothetical protein